VEISFNLKEIKEAARRFWEAAAGKKVIAFHGIMGSGKTTFIHALCDVKGVKDVVGSPTFAVINEYVFPSVCNNGKIYHIDLYRIKDEEEARRAGVEDCFYSDHTCLVEWPEKAAGILPAGTVHVFIDVIDEQNRHLTIQDN
jgi:tRNA threonylcarbamoyladenosine biosynthesis protein TsaE